jgi:hypothetical protein
MQQKMVQIVSTRQMIRYAPRFHKTKKKSQKNHKKKFQKIFRELFFQIFVGYPGLTVFSHFFGEM